MTKYTTRRTALADLCTLVQDTPEANLWGYMQEKHVQHLLEQDSLSGFVDDKLVACGGVVDIWPGLAEAWIAVTPLATQHVSFVYRTVRLYLDNRIVSHKLRRIEAHIRADFEKAQAFAWRLGFSSDAELEQYGPNGEPFLLVSRVI